MIDNLAGDLGRLIRRGRAAERLPHIVKRCRRSLPVQMKCDQAIFIRKTIVVIVLQRKVLAIPVQNKLPVFVGDAPHAIRLIVVIARIRFQIDRRQRSFLALFRRRGCHATGNQERVPVLRRRTQQLIQNRPPQRLRHIIIAQVRHHDDANFLLRQE